jgi:hypothetical protein
MYRQEKSLLTYQIEGRISSYLSSIDDCDEFNLNSKVQLKKTFKMTECIFSLLNYVKNNCLIDNFLLFNKYNLTVNKDAELRTQYLMTWTPIKNEMIISGYLKIDFTVPNIDLFKISNFKNDNIESLSNLIIDLTTLTFAKEQELTIKSLIIVKTNEFYTLNKENSDIIKSEFDRYFINDNIIPTFVYVMQKDINGYYHKYYSNCIVI